MRVAGCDGCGRWPVQHRVRNESIVRRVGWARAHERVRAIAAVQVVLKLKIPWRDGTTHLGMSPLKSMQRRAALVPRSRPQLIRWVSA